MKFLVSLATMLALPGVGVAQAPDDWDLGRNPETKLTIAAVTFDTLGLAVRCMGGSLGVVMTGLPAGSGERSFRYRVGDDTEEESRWISGRDATYAFALWPRAVAKRLSEGGRLSVGVPDGERIRRYVVDVPPSPQAVETVFQACGQTLHPDEADAPPDREDLAGVRWARRAEINFPDRARYEQGIAAIRCRVRASGSLTGCQVESEFPEGSGFGRAATLGAHQSGRVEASEHGANIEGRSVVFVARYSMVDSMGFSAPSRLPPRDGQ